MSREAWNDARLDDLARRMDHGFARVDRRFEHVDRRFEHVEGRLDRLDDAIRGLHSLIVRVSGGMVAGLALLILTRAA